MRYTLLLFIMCISCTGPPQIREEFKANFGASLMSLNNVIQNLPPEDKTVIGNVFRHRVENGTFMSEMSDDEAEIICSGCSDAAKLLSITYHVVLYELELLEDAEDEFYYTRKEFANEYMPIDDWHFLMGIGYSNLGDYIIRISQAARVTEYYLSFLCVIHKLVKNPSPDLLAASDDIRSWFTIVHRTRSNIVLNIVDMKSSMERYIN